MSFDDKLAQILADNERNNINVNTLPAYVDPNSQDNNEQGVGTWLGAAGIGAGRMLNNTITGGLAQILGSIGSGVEWLSPFSGSQADDRYRLMAAGFDPETAQELYPDQDSWITSGAKGLLKAQNYIDDNLTQIRNEVVGDNPSYATQVAEGVGSSLGFMTAGLLTALGTGNPFLGGLVSAATEAASESGGTLGDAYRQGKYDDGGLAAANKSFAANALLNAGLNYVGGHFSPFTAGIRNPFTKFAVNTLGQIGNELVQEPSQQTIEKAAQDSLSNGGNFMTALGQHVGDWRNDLVQLAPSVAGSSLITSLLTGGAGMVNPNIRSNVMEQYRNRNVDRERTIANFMNEIKKQQRLQSKLQSEQQTLNDQTLIDDLNKKIQRSNSEAERLQELLQPQPLQVATQPDYQQFPGKKSRVTTHAGQNQYDTVFKLMEADDLITSHNDDFSINENFPQDRQIRQRGNSANQDEVIRMAGTLDPYALGDNYNAQNGAPIIGQDNTVLSGNGRVLSIRKAPVDKFDAYRKFIIDNAKQFGIDPNLAARMKKPVLVRVLQGDVDLAQFATEANSNTIQQLSAGEQANNDAHTILEHNLLQHYDFNKKLADNSDFLNALASNADSNEQNNLRTDHGKKGLSQNLIARAQNALISIAYGNNDIINKLTEAAPADDLSKNISNALKALAPSFSLIQYQGKSHLAIGRDIAQAVQTLDRYRNNPDKRVDEQLEQQDLGLEETKISDEAEFLLRFFHHFRNNPNNILQGLANYARFAQEQSDGKQLTLDGSQLNESKMTLLEHALGSTLEQARNWKREQDVALEETPEAQAQNQQDNFNNPQGARLVNNSRMNSYDEEIKYGKSVPDYSESTDTRDLRLTPAPRNREAYNSWDIIGLNGNQQQNDFDVPNIADISALQQTYGNNQQTEKQQGNGLNLNDNQGRGNLENIGSSRQISNQREQGQVASEQDNMQNSPFIVPKYVDISALQNNDEDTDTSAIINNKQNDAQQDSNSQQMPKVEVNNSQINGNVQNQQERSKNDDYLPPEIIRTKEGNITVPGANVQRSFIPSEHTQIQKAVKKGQTMTRFFFVKRGEKDTSAPIANNPEKYSYDAKLTGYDGYIGDVQTGAGDNSGVAHAFYGQQDGVHYVGFANENGQFVATYDMSNNRLFINEGSETSGLARRIEDDFKRQFGKNPTEEIIRRLVMHKAINAGEVDTVADAASRIYIAMNENLANQTGISLLDMAMADNLSIQKVNEVGDRGSTQIIPQKSIDGNPVFEAQNIVSLFKNSDASSLLHEFWHIYQEKIKRLGNAGLIKEGTNLFDDWKTIRSEAGLLRANFKERLSPQEYAKWVNSQERNAASFEKYFRQEKAPEGISAQMRQVFNNFKEWLSNIYRKVRDIFYTNANGKHINDFAIDERIRKVFDHILLPHRKLNINQATEQGQKLSSYSDPQGFQEFRQSGLTPQGWFSRWFGKAKNWAGNLFSIAHKSTITDYRTLPFPNQEAEQRFMDAMKAAPKPGIIGRMRQSIRDIAESIKGGDYSDITNSPRKNDPQLRLNDALQAFRNLGRAKISAADKAVTVMTDIIRPLNHKQRDLLNTYTVIRDIMFQIEDMPGSPISFGLTEQEVREMHRKITPMVIEDKAVDSAIKQLDETRKAQAEDFKKYAKILGLNMDGLFRNPDYFRRRVIQYLDAARSGRRTTSARGNLDIQGRYDSELRDIMGHGFFRKRKGTLLDYVTDYVQANAEVRAQLAQDIETMKTLLQIKKDFDIAPRLRKQYGLKSPQLDIDFDESQTFSQSGDEEQKTIHDVIPDGYEAFDPSATRLIETAKSAPENLMSMIANDIAEQNGVPVDEILERLGIQNDANIMVIPIEIANTLRKMAKSRHRGMLGQAAKDLTTWWKRSVLFTPTRNLLYNIRNFTGDLDALIAGNPRALRQLPQAVRELTGYYLHHGNEGYEASQDLQDYIRLSGTLGIQYLNLSAKDAQAILDLIPVPETTKNGRKFPKRADKEAARLQRNSERAQELQDTQEPGKLKKAAAVPLGLIRKFFKTEHEFTEWREHLLRFAAYLEYKNQMESNKDGRPSNWGASIEDEVMSIKDIKERAFKMSNELLGAYDQVSEVGKQLRDMLIPFYSWMEVNMRRTYRLLKNGFKYGYGAQQVKNIGAGKLAAMPLYALSAGQSVAKLMALTMALQMFNRFVFPDADDDLPNDVKYRPHITLGSHNGRTYYFDRIGAVADVLDWASLDSAWLDAKDFANGQKSIGSWLKQITQAPFSKVINGLNPAIKMPIELAMGRSMFPNAFQPSTIRDPAEYVARSFGLAWPYKAARGIPHDNAQEASRLFIYSQDTDEAAYWQTLDRVRQFQNEVLDKHFDGFASTRRGRILANIKKALRYNDGAAVRRFLREYNEADGTKQGLKMSMKAMNPLHGLSEKEKVQFIKWISADDRKYLRKAQRYFHQLADRFIR